MTPCAGLSSLTPLWRNSTWRRRYTSVSCMFVFFNFKYELRGSYIQALMRLSALQFLISMTPTSTKTLLYQGYSTTTHLTRRSVPLSRIQIIPICLCQLCVAGFSVSSTFSCRVDDASHQQFINKGLLFAILIPGLNQFFYFRFPSVSIDPVRIILTEYLRLPC